MFGLIDSLVDIEFIFVLDTGYNETAGCTMHVDTIDPSPVLAWLPGSEPGPDCRFTNATWLNFTLAGTHVDDLASLMLIASSDAGDPVALRSR